jgi:hypothetical protein
LFFAEKLASLTIGFWFGSQFGFDSKSGVAMVLLVGFSAKNLSKWLPNFSYRLVGFSD